MGRNNNQEAEARWHYLTIGSEGFLFRWNGILFNFVFHKLWCLCRRGTPHKKSFTLHKKIYFHLVNIIFWCWNRMLSVIWVPKFAPSVYNTIFENGSPMSDLTIQFSCFYFQIRWKYGVTRFWMLWVNFGTTSGNNLKLLKYNLKSLKSRKYRICRTRYWIFGLRCEVECEWSIIVDCVSLGFWRLKAKYKGHSNKNSPIRTGFSRLGNFVMSGSECKGVFIWNTEPLDAKAKNTIFECLQAHEVSVTAATFSPTVEAIECLDSCQRRLLQHQLQQQQQQSHKQGCKKYIVSKYILTIKKKSRNLISPLPRGGRRISCSAFLSRRPFGYYLPIASYATIFGICSQVVKQ